MKKRNKEGAAKIRINFCLKSSYIPRIPWICWIFVIFHCLRYHRTSGIEQVFIGVQELLRHGHSSVFGCAYKRGMLIHSVPAGSHDPWGEIFKSLLYDITLDSPKPTIVDIGSHIGASVLFFISKYPNAHIVAFEPNPVTFALLSANIHNNAKDASVVLHNLGIARRREKRVLSYAEDSLSLASMYTSKQKQRQVEIKCIRLRDAIGNIGTIDLLKIDTEGAEYEVIEDLLSYANRIKTIIIEVHNRSDRSMAVLLQKISLRYTTTICSPFMYNYIASLSSIRPPTPNALLVFGRLKHVDKK